MKRTVLILDAAAEHILLQRRIRQKAKRVTKKARIDHFQKVIVKKSLPNIYVMDEDEMFLLMVKDRNLKMGARK